MFVLDNRSFNPLLYPSHELDQSTGDLYIQHQGAALLDYFAGEAMKAILADTIANSVAMQRSVPNGPMNRPLKCYAPDINTFRRKCCDIRPNRPPRSSCSPRYKGYLEHLWCSSLFTPSDALRRTRIFYVDAE